MAQLNCSGAQPHNLEHPPLTPPPTSIQEAIAQLKSTWFFLPEMERAQAVRQIVNAGLSRRYLAKALNISEGTVRNLLLILEARPEDQEAFRQREISQSELIRRARGLPPREPVRQPEPTRIASEPEYPQERDPFDLTETILDWLAARSLRSFSARSILEECLRILNRSEKMGNLPVDRPPAGMPVAEVIRRCQPGPRRYDFFYITFYVDWLCNWVVRLATDANHWREALTQALSQVNANGDRP
jgi:hypothetical protein